jgi:hypothetical protein
MNPASRLGTLLFSVDSEELKIPQQKGTFASNLKSAATGLATSNCKNARGLAFTTGT